ncbi:MAG TPA: bifunctional shikimate kinase/3-dehydroquinate synthase [Solirubrobacteraceae bacterium]|nr:bifunctional shikimate kinase/3-dehydroquinate synthase [Solirubrobacteraceae bacterium]
MAIVLIGFMGAGKSTAAREIADALEVPARDSDRLLSERLGHEPAREFELNGEEAFRAAEETLVCELLAEHRGDEAVIALGGGSVTSARVREALDGHSVVWLDVGVEEAWSRVRAQQGGDERPLAHDAAAFAALHGERRALYEPLADAVVSGLALGGAGKGLARALLALDQAPRGVRMLWASAASGSYPVFLGRRLITGQKAETHALLWPTAAEGSRQFLVSDAAVHGLYARYVKGTGELAGTHVIDPGESSKTLASAEQIWMAMVEAGVTRRDRIVALGGGVVGDLAGFCAAGYQRGIPFVQVPTTLVAQVDSAFGGKTGVDLPAAKNYVGAYHQPAAVIVDPATLQTLPEAELAAGWVEVLKTALIAGGGLWDAVAAGEDGFGEDGSGEDATRRDATILDCIRTKLGVVAADERDGGRRQVLNLGHTVGHAIETATGYGRYRHGEAVGLGLLAALRLSEQDGLRTQVRELLTAKKLPVSAELNVEDVLRALTRDKKRIGANVPFVLVDAPGNVQEGRMVADADLRAAVEELCA